MADTLWKRYARRVRRRLYRYLVPEVIGTIQSQTEQLSERVAKLELVQSQTEQLSERVAKLELVQSQTEQLSERVAKLELVQSQTEQLSERVAKLELLLEHPDLFAESCEESSFTSPVVSIVMPTWDRGRVIGAAIRSVQAQAFSDWELIVVDDGSSDDTAEVMAAFKQDVRIRYVVQTHAGQCRARNHGLRLARGALIAYLDSDNVWYPGYLAAAVAVFAAKSSVDCLYGAMVTDVHGEHLLFSPFDRERLVVGNYIGMSTFMHRRQLIDRYGTFDEELSSLEDWDLILRYTAHAPAYRLPALAVRYRVVDAKRVTLTTAHDNAFKRIRAKWEHA